MKTLLIIDAQNDFMPGGALAVPGGNTIIPIINKVQEKFDLIIATQDWHPNNHTSFASNHKSKKEFELIKLDGMDQVLWPDHCVQDSVGAQFHADLKTTTIEAIFRKGMNFKIDSYSGFYDNAHLKSTGLTGYLKEKGVEEIYMAGLAGEYCVYFTAKDALKEGFSVFLIDDAIRALQPTDYETAKVDILRRGGKILDSGNLGF